MNQPTLITRIYGVLVVTVSMLTFVVATCLGWSVMFESPYLTYGNLPFEATPAVRAGETIDLVVQRCNAARTKRNYTTTRVLTNIDVGTVLLLPSVVVDIEPGCTSSISRIHQIPATAAPGVYRLSGVAMVSGLVMNHRVPWVSRPFEVLPARAAKEN